KKTDNNFFEYLLENRFPHFLALTVPLIIVRTAIPIVFVDFKQLVKPFNMLADVYMVFLIIWMMMSVIRSAGDSIRTRAAFREKPIDSYLQVIRIVLFLIGAVVI